MHTPPDTPPVTPDTPGPDDPTSPDSTPEPPAPPVSEPSIDTTRKDVPGPDSHAPVRASAPKLPHERDESVHVTSATPDKDMQQAYRDLQRGLQDTDRGPPSDRAYKKL